jgi:hypothetical protein
MKHNINEVAQTIAKEIEKFDVNVPADNGTFHNTLGWTKRKSEAHQMAGWFLGKVEKIHLAEEEKEVFKELQSQLRDLALEIVAKQRSLISLAPAGGIVTGRKGEL